MEYGSIIYQSPFPHLMFVGDHCFCCQYQGISELWLVHLPYFQTIYVPPSLNFYSPGQIY